jgi:hypothetical protein
MCQTHTHLYLPVSSFSVSLSQINHVSAEQEQRIFPCVSGRPLIAWVWNIADHGIEVGSRWAMVDQYIIRFCHSILKPTALPVNCLTGGPRFDIPVLISPHLHTQWYAMLQQSVQNNLIVAGCAYGDKDCPRHQLIRIPPSCKLIQQVRSSKMGRKKKKPQKSCLPMMPLQCLHRASIEPGVSWFFLVSSHLIGQSFEWISIAL